MEGATNMSWQNSLHGKWDFYLDNEGTEPNSVYSTKELTTPSTFEDKIEIPGTMQEQGFGNDINHKTPWISSLHDKLWYQREEYKTEGDKVLTPFLSQPKKHYLGKAWYQKSFVVPEDLEGHIFYFTMECVKWKTDVWVDDRHVGSEISLSAPHVHCLGELEAGDHQVTVCVDNSFIHPYRPDAHGVTDGIGLTWNGIAGQVSIKAKPYIHMEDIRTFPSIDKEEVLVEINLKNHKDSEKEVTISAGDHSQTYKVGEGDNPVEFTIPYKNRVELWDEYNKNVHKLDLVMEFEDFRQEESTTFGFRELEVKDGLFYVNGRPTFFRGTHSGGDFPLTGHPSTNVDDWKKIIRKCQEYGLNYIRFHSFCPPKAAFIAADEEGFYLQVECGMWNVFNEGNEMMDTLWDETKNILDAYGNHPSFVMLAPSNEPYGDWYKPLSDWVIDCREYDSRRLYTTQSGWPFPVKPSEIEDTDYVYFHRSGYGIMPGGTIRNTKGWHGKDYRKSLEGIKYPVVSHELGQWCSYPDYDVIDKFTGYLEPSNYIIFRENAKKRGVYSQHKEFAYLSGKVKSQLYKEELEATFRTPHIYGFELLDLHDYIGQGTALVGFLDPFWEDKGFITPDEFKQFCSETVPLLRIAKRVYTNNETIDYPVEICHFAKDELKDATPYWKLLDEEGNVVEEGKFETKTIPLAKNTDLGRLKLSLKDLGVPGTFTIEIGIEDTDIKNTWNIWVYEEYKLEDTDKEIDLRKSERKSLSLNEEKADKEAVYTRSLKEALAELALGKKVLYSPLPEHHRLESVPLFSRTVFWNAQMGPTYRRGMGFVCQDDHPALANFPTKNYKEWQWDEILDGGYGLNLSELPSEITPILQPIDDWNRNYRLGMILEAKVGEGSLLLVTADLDSNLDKRPVARQLRKSLFEYVCSNEFNPSDVLTVDMLEKSFFPRLIMEENEVQVKIADKPLGKDEIKAMIDGDPGSYYSSEELEYPFTIEMEAKEEVATKGLIYMPRQNDRQRGGDIKGYRVEAFYDGSWQVICEGELVSSLDPKEIIFPSEVTSNKIRFVGLYGFSGQGISSWEMDSDGWHQEVIDYEDKIAAISDLLFIPSKVDLDYLDKATREKLRISEEQVSVIEKTATKEIDN